MSYQKRFSMKILVLGKGISGLCISYYLSKYGHDITIYGKKDPSQRSSNWAQGIICNKGLVYCHSPLFDYKLKSLSFIKSLLSELNSLGFSIDSNFREVIELYNDDFNPLFKRIYKRNYQGLFRNSNGSFNESLHLKKHKGIMTYPSEGWFHVGQFLIALETILKKNYDQKFVDKHIGVEELREIKKDFDLTICAAGWGSSNILEGFIDNAPTLKPVSGQTLRYRSDVRQYINIVKGTKSIIWNGNDIFVGSTSIKSESPSLMDLKKERDELKTFLLETVDKDVELNAIEPLSSGHGIRVLSKSRAPIWGYNDDKTFLFLTGMYKNGLQLAPLLSREIAESIENNTDFSDFKYQS